MPSLGPRQFRQTSMGHQKKHRLRNHHFLEDDKDEWRLPAEQTLAERRLVEMTQVRSPGVSMR